MISHATYRHMPTFRVTESRTFHLTDNDQTIKVDPLQPCTSGTHLQCQTDWTKCVLYQIGIDEELSCPADAKHSSIDSITGTCCNTLADNPIGFFKIDYLPKTTMDVARKDNGDGMLAPFQRNCVNGMIHQHPSSSSRGDETPLQKGPRSTPGRH